MPSAAFSAPGGVIARMSPGAGITTSRATLTPAVTTASAARGTRAIIEGPPRSLFGRRLAWGGPAVRSCQPPLSRQPLVLAHRESIGHPCDVVAHGAFLVGAVGK